MPGDHGHRQRRGLDLEERAPGLFRIGLAGGDGLKRGAANSRVSRMVEDVDQLGQGFFIPQHALRLDHRGLDLGIWIA